MQVAVCRHCGAKNRIDESRLANSEAKCGRCGEKLGSGSASEQDSKPINITDQTFEREVLQTTGRPILVDCWAPWCPPCRMIAPLLDQLAAESHGSYRIAKLNIDENPQVSSRFQISSIPTMLIFKDGKLIDRLIGAHPKQTIAERLRVASKFPA
jgi:thioredoxin 2